MLAEAKYRESLLESETVRANKAESEKIENLKQFDDKKKQIDELKREAFKLKKESGLNE